MPCLAKSPSLQSIWQRPHMALPPQTESISTPSDRAASSTGVPIGKRPRLPLGVNTTFASLALCASSIDVVSVWSDINYHLNRDAVTALSEAASVSANVSCCLCIVTVVRHCHLWLDGVDAKHVGLCPHQWQAPDICQSSADNQGRGPSVRQPPSPLP